MAHLRLRTATHWLVTMYLLIALGVALFFLHTSIQLNRKQQREHKKQEQQQMAQHNCAGIPTANKQQKLPGHQQRYSFYEMPPRRWYPPRLGMGKCPPLFGKVTVIVLVEQKMKPLTMNYGVAQGSLDCYIRSTNYTLKKVDLDDDLRSQRYCNKYKQLFFKKHCIVAHYLNETDWMLVLDADTGVVNPSHCIEEWIDDRVDLLFYERFFNWEIMSGNYLVRNTQFARKFLLDWADMEFWQPFFSSADNGALQLHILKTVLPKAKIEINACERHWNRSVDYDTLMSYTTCVRNALGAQRIWPPKVRIYRRAHGFAHDWFMTDDGFTDFDFMFHGWKPHNISGEWKSPFDKMPNPAECRAGSFDGWHWRKNKRISIATSRVLLEDQERHSAEAYPLRARMTNAHLTEPDIAECYPHCDEHY